MCWICYLVWWPSNTWGFCSLNQAQRGKRGLLASGLYEQSCSFSKIFKTSFKFNPSHVLSQYRRVNFTFRQLILGHIVVLLWKIHFSLSLQYSLSVFFSPLTILRPRKGDLVYISRHSICFHLWHTPNNLYKQAPCCQQCHTSHLPLKVCSASCPAHNQISDTSPDRGLAKDLFGEMRKCRRS